METNKAKRQAQVQLKTIREMVKALRDAFNYNTQKENNEDNENKEKILISLEEAEDAIRIFPLEVSVRTGWHHPNNDGESEEYRIILRTSGPEVQLIGYLYRNCPKNVRLEYRDMSSPWEEYLLDKDEEEDCFYYVKQFYF